MTPIGLTVEAVWSGAETITKTARCGESIWGRRHRHVSGAGQGLVRDPRIRPGDLHAAGQRVVCQRRGTVWRQGESDV
jgi:hypothetical protein